MLEHVAHLKPRSPLRAGALSLLAPGLGQLYNGQWRKALFFFLIEYLLCAWLVSRFATFAGMMQGLAGIVLFLGAAVGDAALSARRRQAYVLRSFNRGWIYVAVLTFGILATLGMDWLLGNNLYQTFKVPSPSMEPTLVPGDRFMGAVLDADEPLLRGDVVVFHPPGRDGIWYVKRVVGLPGETVRVTHGHVRIDGVDLAEPYAAYEEGVADSGDSDEQVRLLDVGEYWLMGDNRGHSMDSRVFGPVGRERMGYRALYLYWAGDSGLFPGSGARLGIRLD
ncbi:signal peptidase I [Pseudodesulfovibrio senegalensis]|jgi:signal peptidase I|uniref:Signal peptidase I n=1 Tax=Pseudodesulfovibrio senegalensis TaxID=1721087 RepID=A0A6N6N3M7_9BACT|nr:signal peptidase I [Pseudodesulfovibrio senegalensis]KAB1442100.1 signal peptidase I [Pseudodesulfovibrio senegalensis]